MDTIDTLDLSLKDLIHYLPGHIYLKDQDGFFLDCNEQQAKDLGFSSAQELIGKNSYEICDKRQRNIIQSHDLKVMQSGQPHIFREFNYISHKFPLRDSDSHIIGIIGISLELGQFESTLLNTNYALEQIIASLPGHIYWKDRNCKLLGCNEQQAKTANLSSRHEIVGKSAYDLLGIHIPEEERQRQAEITDDLDKKIMISNQIQKVEEFTTLPDGQKAYYLSTKMPLHDTKGNVTGLAGISIDITELKIKEQALKKAIKQAEVANEAKKEFLYNMRHDIRTPFSGVFSLAQLLASSEKDTNKKELLTCISESAENLLDFLNNILEFVQIESGNIPILHKPFNLKDTINSVIKINKPVAMDKKLNLSPAFESHFPEKIISDEFRIKRILLNLVSNAVKFTDKGNIIIQADIKKHQEHGLLLKLIVKDTGIGMPEDTSDCIFEAFNRLTSSYSSTYKGTGLGLKVVRQFTEGLGGQVAVDSTLNQGTTMTIILPIKLPLLDDL